MSDDKNGTSGAPVDAGGEEQESQDSSADSVGKDSVKYDTYKKTVSEAKKAKAEAAQYKAELDKLNQEKLGAEGKKDELIQALQKEKMDLKSQLNKAVSSFARSKVQEKFMTDLVKVGCQDPDLIMKAYADDLEGIDFDDSFSPDEEQKNIVIEKWRKEKPNLFAKSAPNVGNHNIKNTNLGDKKTKSVSSMSTEELMEMWASSQKR